MFYSTVVKNDGNIAVNEVTCSACNEVVETRSQTRHDKYCTVALWLEIAPVGERSSTLLHQAKIDAHNSRCPAKKR